MLVLVDPGVGDFAGGEIHDGVMLVVVERKFLIFETERAVLEPTEFEGEKLIDSSGEDKMFGKIVQRCFLGEIIARGLDLNSFEEGFDENAIAPFGDALVGVIEIIVVIGETKREPLDDRGG